MKNSAIAIDPAASDTAGADGAQDGGLRAALGERRRRGDAGGAVATVTFIVLLGVAVALLGYLVTAG
ncbi:hypothetical protein [Streptomyces sp. KLOTTS4A1]|uniref:hypothetical protein n=1 Tax=Streptomyces sp. KLOTTS4A1 TaxID=3390996 RepID=UPI0039F63FF4